MVFLENLKSELEALRPIISELHDVYDIERSQERIAELHEKAAEPNFWDDMEKSQKVLQETRNLEGKLEKYNKFKSSFEDIEVLIEMAADEGDEDMIDEIQSELKTLKEGLDAAQLDTLLTGEYDHNNAIINFHAGAGGTEAQDWSEMLFRMYHKWCESHGFKMTTLDYLEGAEAGMKSASVIVEGENAYGYLKSEAGIHRLVRISPFDSSGSRHTSFSAVDVMPEIDDTIEVDIRPEDIKMDVYRASGAGGQHINKTSSAIRITHLPTGMVVECQDERSQFKNKEKALKVLRSRLLDQKVQAQNKEIADNRRSQVGTGDRSERIRTYNYPEGRISDHRIGLTIYRLEQVLNGALDEIIDALATADQAAKLASQEEE